MPIARRLFFFGLMALFTFAQTMAGAATFTPPPFPRLGGYLIGGSHNYDDSAYAAQIARLDVAILAVWPGWSGASGQSLQQAVSAIKQTNPNEVILLYQDIMEASSSGGAWSTVNTQLNNNGWWCYLNGSGGSLVSSGYTYLTNITQFTPPNSSGQRYIDWQAAWQVQTFITPSPAVDGFYTDNVNYGPPGNCDWNRDGTTDSNSNATVQTWWREGYAAYFNDLKAKMAGKYLTGNLATWGQSSPVAPEYQGMLQGGVMEGIIGNSWSYETWGGWQTMMKYYREIMSATASPQLVIFAQSGNPTDYQSFRYGFASCLMDNGYYYLSNNGDYHSVYWFDEFNTSLGQATSQPPTTAWQNGVYRRDFQNGIALVNPKGNGPKTVTLETSYRHLSGQQAPTVNNGQAVTTVTLNDRDGVILLRTSAQPVPDAPTLTVQ
jgi:hypothetical protein